jgi:tetratricopeptide (TPR) repeat protein
MTRILHFAFLLAALIGSACITRAQDQTHPATTGSGSSSEKPSAKDAKSSQDNKTGGDTSTPKKSSASDNPFPEEESQKAAKAVEQGGTAPAPADMQGDPTPAPRDGDEAKGGNNDDEGVSSSRTRLEGMNDTDPDASRSQPKTSITSVAHNPKLAQEDVAIGKMYMQSENYKGAYIRYKEALTLDPESVDAAFGVAETARKMNQTQEAIANYKLCLELDPGGPRSKASRKALSQLQAAQSQ